MNAGYLSSILMCIILILFASGWKDVLFRGVSHTRILLFFAAWMISGMWSIEAGPFHIRMTAVLLLSAALLSTWSIREPLWRVHAWTSGLLIGSFDFFMREFKGWQIMMQEFGPLVPPSLILAATVFVLGRQPLWQFTAVTVGLLLSDGAGIWLHREAASVLFAGRASFADHWWLTLFAARVLTVSFEQTARWTVSSLRHLQRNRNEWGD